MSTPVLPDNFSTAELKYSWQCWFCENNSWEKRSLSRSSPIFIARLPEGWRQLDEYRFVCPAHSIVTIIDGKTV